MNLFAGLQHRWLRFQFDLTRRLRFYQKMRQFVMAAIPIDIALKTIHRRYAGLDDRGNVVAPRRMLAAMTEQWMQQIGEEGASLAVLQGWIPEEELGPIIAAEATGSAMRNEEGKFPLETGFEEAQSIATTKMRIMREVRGGLAMPIIVGFIAMGMYIGFDAFFSPMIRSIAKNAQLDSVTMLVLAVTSFVHHYWTFLLGGGIGLGLLVVRSLPSAPGPFRRYLDVIPPWSIYRVIARASVLKQMGAMLRNKAPLDTVLAQLRDTSSPYVAHYIREMIDAKATGMPEAKAMDVGFFDVETAGDLVDMGKAGRFDAVMSSVAAITLEQTIDGVKVRVAIIQYLSLLVLGISMAAMVAAFYGATSGISGAGQQTSRLR